MAPYEFPQKISVRSFQPFGQLYATYTYTNVLFYYIEDRYNAAIFNIHPAKICLFYKFIFDSKNSRNQKWKSLVEIVFNFWWNVIISGM